MSTSLLSMNCSRFVYCLFGWLLCWPVAAEPPPIRYDGYEERDIRVYFSHAGDGIGRIDQPPPADLEENGLALLFDTYDDTGSTGRAWIWPNTYYLGYFVTTKEMDGGRFAIFKGPDPYGSSQRIALNREGYLRVVTGYFGMDDRGDSLVRVSRGEVFRLNGTDYTVQSLARSEAVLREVKTGREITLPLSPLGQLRRENLQLRREVQGLRRDYWAQLYSERTPLLIACGAMLFSFLICYACIFLGLSTLEDHPRRKRYRPPQERRSPPPRRASPGARF